MPIIKGKLAKEYVLNDHEKVIVDANLDKIKAGIKGHYIMEYGGHTLRLYEAHAYNKHKALPRLFNPSR